MEPVAEFFRQNLVIIYFFYGLAFFCMGLFVWMESNRASTFKLAQAMGPLAGFGIIHGLHEWIEMFQNMPMAILLPQWVLSENLRLTHLVISFVLLIIFGVRLIYANQSPAKHEKLFAFIAAGSLLLVWGISILITRQVYKPSQQELYTAIDVLARYSLGIPGALLAAWAIALEQKTFHKHGLNKSGDDLMRAAIALIIYGLVGQIFVRESFLFPSNLINSNLFLLLFGIPVQLFRAFVAAIMAFFMVRAMRAFELERQHKLLEANEARLAAQDLALAVQKNAQEETERLNRDLRTALTDLKLVFDFSSSMAKTLERDTVANTAVAHIVDAQTWVHGAAILWQEKEDSRPEKISQAGFLDCGKSVDIDLLDHICRAIFAQKKALRYFAGEFTSSDSLPHPQDTFMLGFPLFRQEEVSGVLILQVNTTAVPISAKEIILLQTVVGQLNIALENAALYQEVWDRDTLRGELLHQVVSAQEQERQRIARELHDGTGQLLTALGLGFAATVNSVRTKPSLAQKQLITLKEMVNQALRELRDLISDLRPSVLDDLGLIPALQSLVKTFEQRMQDSSQPLEATLHINGDIHRLQPDIETIAFRIIQEALTNVAKHAQAGKVLIKLALNEHCLRLIITDDGLGFASERYLSQKATSPAWGLLGMQERVALVGGEFQIQSQVGDGTTITASLPIMNKGEGYVENPVAIGR